MEQAPKRVKVDFTDTVSVMCMMRSAEAHQFHVPRELFKSRAGRFTNEDSLDFKVTSSHPTTFSDYLHLLYSGKVAIHEEVPENDAAVEEKWQRIIELLELCYYLEDSKGENTVMQEILRMLEDSYPPVKTIDMAYDTAWYMGYYALRPLFVKRAVDRWAPNDKIDAGDIAEMSHGAAFMVDVADEFARRAAEARPAGER